MHRYLAVLLLLAAQQPSPEMKKLEDFTQSEPKNARAWGALGAALIRNKEYDKAIEVLGTVLQLQPNAAPAMYNTGVAYALKGDKDAAFTWLEKAKATKQLDMTQIQADTDLTSLTSDPRFNALLPKPE